MRKENNMTQKEIDKIFQDIQDCLEKLRGTGVEVLFFAENKNRGVVNGSVSGLAALVTYNMIRYPIVKSIFEMAVKEYPKLVSMFGDGIKDEVLEHEIVDTPENKPGN